MNDLYAWSDFPGQAISDKDLVVFDVDQVLIDPRDAILSGANEPAKSRYFKDLEQRLGVEQANWLYSIIIKERAVSLTEVGVDELIKNLQSRTIAYLALTAFPSGQFGVIPDVMDFRYEQLQSLDLEFNYSFKNTKRHIFSELAEHLTAPRLPSFDRGILYTGQGGFGAPSLQKASLLASFLRLTGRHYPKIWFIDDNKSHLEAMKGWAQSQNQAVELFHYQGALRSKRPLNEPQVRRQFRHLEQYHTWLGDGHSLLHGG